MKILQLAIVLTLIFPTLCLAEVKSAHVKVAFERDGYLWTLINNKEEKLTDEKATYPYPPQWSHDGKMLLYQKEATAEFPEENKTQNELWVYDFETKKHIRIFYDGYSPKWSPVENIIAFQSRGVLNISDLDRFYNISLGVDSFEWQPDGKGFIASSSAQLRPDGWTNPILYNIPSENGYTNIKSLSNAKKLFVIPNEVKKGKVSVLSIGAESLTYSPNHKWISFIVTPTASWSMDSDMLCVISSDGKEFEVIDEIILHLDEPKWAYKKNLLAYIAGGGRIVFGFKNKKLKVTELPTTKTLDLTPPNFAEMGFTWIDDSAFIVSRVKEAEWSNDPKKRPDASLYFVELNGEKQVKITNPPKNKTDTQPRYLSSINKITWLRHSKTDYRGDLWIANTDGRDAKLWVRDVGGYAFYPSK
ncbi:TolB family protein [Ferdinandcohnia quinoae]|uniref:TolB domain-containing protein n=1 Tax=Fredinandcohnia quinoae TaxID=2918902 RepID=A0AAW5E943_9BACI|nr:TolB domain-containing protein [Fredinandcohnia sp. SECRCQ15]MCH1626422.1 TolB domain-containing protein [Fredinandcohnia sp. SECRCQ15]